MTDPWHTCSIFIPTGTWLIVMVISCRIYMTYMDGMGMVIHHYIPIIWDFPPRKGGDE